MYSTCRRERGREMGHRARVATWALGWKQARLEADRRAHVTASQRELLRRGRPHRSRHGQLRLAHLLVRCGADHWRDGPHAPPLAAFELQHEHVAVVGVRVDGASMRRREVHVGEGVGHVVAQRRTQRMHAGAATLGVVHDERGAVKVGGGSAVVLLRRVLVLEHYE